MLYSIENFKMAFPQRYVHPWSIKFAIHNIIKFLYLSFCLCIHTAIYTCGTGTYIRMQTILASKIYFSTKYLEHPRLWELNIRSSLLIITCNRIHHFLDIFVVPPFSFLPFSLNAFLHPVLAKPQSVHTYMSCSWKQNFMQ